jgi:enamine deaminase RidA (YjgF/YER057c/UK114 family)
MGFIMHTILQPPDWARPKGYSNGILARGRETIYTGGLVGWDAEGRFTRTDFVGQVRTTLENIVAVLTEADAGPEHLVRLTWYITDKKAYHDNLHAIGQAYREVIGRHYPAMAVVEVSALMEDQALVEIEATAVK